MTAIHYSIVKAKLQVRTKVNDNTIIKIREVLTNTAPLVTVSVNKHLNIFLSLSLCLTRDSSSVGKCWVLRVIVCVWRKRDRYHWESYTQPHPSPLAMSSFSMYAMMKWLHDYLYRNIAAGLEMDVEGGGDTNTCHQPVSFWESHL